MVIALSMTTACGRTDSAAPTDPPVPTPTEAPTAVGSPTHMPPTRTPRPRPDRCLFPADVDGDGDLEDIGYFRFDWDGQPVVVSTSSGDIEIAGPSGLPTGPRNLLIHLEPSPPSRIDLGPDFPVGGHVLALPDAASVELRDGSGRVLLQRIADPANDGLFPINLDILSLERIAEAQEGSRVILFFRGKRTIPLTSSYEAWEVRQGTAVYRAQVQRNGTTAFAKIEDGAADPWDGSVTVADRSIEWALPMGMDGPFSGHTLRSDLQGDETPAYPADSFERMFNAAITACGA